MSLFYFLFFSSFHSFFFISPHFSSQHFSSLLFLPFVSLSQPFSTLHLHIFLLHSSFLHPSFFSILFNAVHFTRHIDLTTGVYWDSGFLSIVTFLLVARPAVIPILLHKHTRLAIQGRVHRDRCKKRRLLCATCDAWLLLYETQFLDPSMQDHNDSCTGGASVVR